MERALKEERLGLAAIAKAFVKECPEPGRLLRRLEMMARNAQADPKVTMAVRQCLLDGTTIVRTTIEREMGRPQTLMDPHIGHVTPAAVDRLTGGDAPPAEQLGLMANDTETAHSERTQTLTATHEALVTVLRQGSATDEEIVRRYKALHGVPQQSEKALVTRRRELTTMGRVRDSGSKHRGEPLWTLIENTQGRR